MSNDVSNSSSTSDGSGIKLEILSPEKIVYKGLSTSVSVPGKLGYMTILPGHAAMIAELDTGRLSFTAQGGVEHHYAIAGGFVEIQEGNARVLVDVIEKPGDIDVSRATKSQLRAQERMSGKPQAGDVVIDYERAGAALKRAQTRIESATKQ